MRYPSILTAGAVLIAGTTLGLNTALESRNPDGHVRSSAIALEAITALPPVLPASVPAVPIRDVLDTQLGSASYYANSLAGRRTASGVRYDPTALVAAHPSLPFGSLLRVTNERNGRSVEVRVVDRGPFARGRVLDLSRRAAERLDFIRRGHTRVIIEVLRYGGSEESRS